MATTPSFAPTGRPTLRPLAAVGLVIVGLSCQEVGASFAVLLFPSVGAIGMVSLRLVFSALILLVVFRPTLRGYGVSDWMTVILFGIALAGMNALFYEALARVPLGATVTIEVLGPLVLSVIVSRRAASWLWAVLAFAGVALLGQGRVEQLDPVGVAFAFGAAVALLSSTIPYALELVALRRLPPATFSILMSLAPAIATAAGFLILGQRLSIIAIVAIALVITASIGAVRTASRTARGRSMPQA